MRVKFIIDSASDVLPEEAKTMGVCHIPLKVVFGDETYDDAVDLSHKAFFEKLVASKKLPTTCQITPTAFAERYAQLTADGSEVVAITISSKLSGTYQSAMIAAMEYPGKVFVVDSRSVSLGQRILIQHGLSLAEQGFGAEDIARMLEFQREKIRVMALLDTLEYLKKGGRISSTVALAGTLLSIKPVIGLDDGAVAMIGKARGSKQGNNLLRLLISQCGGINFDMPFCLAYSGLSDAMLKKYITDSAELWQGKTEHLPIATVGCAIGAHAGPGAIAVAFFES